MNDMVQTLWKKYELPKEKQTHCRLVSRVAVFLGKRLVSKGEQIDNDKLSLAALLHDIDKQIPRIPGESHPDTAVRVLKNEGLGDIADIVRTHPVHTIETDDPPRSWEQKLLYLSDKMVKYEVLTVDRRFALWYAEDIPSEAADMLRRVYPKVKDLESYVFDIVGITPDDLSKFAKQGIL